MSDDAPLPSRLVAPNYASIRDLMPASWQQRLAIAVHDARFALVPRYETEQLPGDWLLPGTALQDETLLPELHAAIAPHLECACQALGLDPFRMGRVETQVHLLHHACGWEWHDDRDGLEAGTAPRLSYQIVLRSVPCMFRGGAIEFPNGELVELEPNRLLLLPATQQRRIQRVECPSANLMHGRWTCYGRVWAES